MKKFYTLILAAIAVVPAMAQESKTTAVATFDDVEGITLNADSVFNGTKENADSVVDGESWGTQFTAYYSHFKQGPFTFTQSISTWKNPSYSYDSWSGIAISACKDTSFVDYTLGQYHDVTGGAYEGDNFAVIYGTTDSIIVDKGTTLKSVRLTNSAYTFHNVAYGDAPAKAFSKDGDYFKVTIIGVKDDNTTVSKDVTLASYNNGKLDYISDWQEVDLSEFGEVRAIKFAFDGSDTGAYGLNTATYVCLDNLTGDVTNGIATVNGSKDVKEVARYSLDGVRLSAPQHGINIVKMSDGTTRKVFVK